MNKTIDLCNNESLSRGVFPNGDDVRYSIAPGVMVQAKARCENIDDWHELKG